jgi:hypothetical protein
VNSYSQEGEEEEERKTWILYAQCKVVFWEFAHMVWSTLWKYHGILIIVLFICCQKWSKESHEENNKRDGLGVNSTLRRAENTTENVGILTEKAGTSCCTWNRLRGFIHYNVQYVMFNVMYMTLNLQLDV